MYCFLYYAKQWKTWALAADGWGSVVDCNCFRRTKCSSIELIRALCNLCFKTSVKKHLWLKWFLYCNVKKKLCEKLKLCKLVFFLRVKWRKVAGEKNLFPCLRVVFLVDLFLHNSVHVLVTAQIKDPQTYFLYSFLKAHFHHTFLHL